MTMSNVITPTYSTEEYKEVLTNMLHHNACNITFTKINGETRIMPCTLRKDLIPYVTEGTKPKRERKLTPNVLSVWCIDKAAWRSFRVDSVTTVEIIKEINNVKH